MSAIKSFNQCYFYHQTMYSTWLFMHKLHHATRSLACFVLNLVNPLTLDNKVANGILMVQLSAMPHCRLCLFSWLDKGFYSSQCGVDSVLALYARKNFLFTKPQGLVISHILDSYQHSAIFSALQPEFSTLKQMALHP